MSQYNLDRIFQPRRVAVVGACESNGSIGNALKKNLIAGGFQGKLHKAVGSNMIIGQI